MAGTNQIKVLLVEDQQIMERLLRRIVDTQSEVAILNVTGVASVDTQVASYLLQTVKSLSLLGARCVLAGIQPHVAQTIISLGLDTGQVVVRRDIEDSLKWVLQNPGHPLEKGDHPTEVSAAGKHTLYSAWRLESGINR